MHSKKLGLLAATAVTTFGVTSMAQAIDVTNKVTAKTSGKKGTKKKPRALGLTFKIKTTADNTAENGSFSTKRVVVHFDKKLDFRGIKKFPTCANKIVASKPQKCPKGSKIGTGVAQAIVGEGQIEANPKIEAYNDKNGKINMKLIARPGEIDSSGILVGKLKRDSKSAFGSKLDVPIPSKLQSQLGLTITITRFDLKISRKTYKRKAYIASIGCSSRKYKFQTDFTFSDNTKDTVKSTSKC